MDRRDFLKLFALSAAGLYIPKVTYFDMGRTLSTYTDEEFLFHSPSFMQDGGFIIPPEVEPALLKFIEEQKNVIIGKFAVPQKLLGGVGSKTWLEELRRVEKLRGIK